MNAAPVTTLHEDRGPWSLTGLREMAQACRELADAVERFISNPDPDPEADRFKAEMLRSCFVDAADAMRDFVHRGLSAGDELKAPMVLELAHTSQHGEAITLLQIECFDARPCDHLVIYRAPEPGGGVIRIAELFTGEHSTARALDAYTRTADRVARRS